MNFIRSILPGGGHRMISENKSLDMAKITPRMYAMSYPSENFLESMYHNSQNDIAEYLNKNHPKKYLIFNLSGIPYEAEKFNKSVINYFWPDHKAPPLYDIFNIIFQAYKYLGQDKENVIVVHCLAGKGRTGTICCSLLLYAKLLSCSRDANNYFSFKRFKKLDKGVQEPSQVRYIEYFDKMLNSQKFRGLEFKAFEIKKVHITGIKLKDGESIEYKFETNFYKENESQFYLSEKKGQIVAGDVTINIYRNGALKAWLFFNTSFLDYNQNRLFFGIKDIDPRFLVKQPDYNLMSVELIICPYPYKRQNNNNGNFNNFNQNNINNNCNNSGNFNNFNQNNNNNNFNNFNNNFNQNNNNNFNQNNNSNNFNNNFNQNNNNNFNQNNNNNNFNNFNQNNNNNYNQNNNNFNQNNNINFNQNNNNNNFNNSNQNNNNFNQNNNNNYNQNNNNFNPNNNNFNQNYNNNFNQNNNNGNFNNFNQNNNNGNFNNYNQNNMNNNNNNNNYNNNNNNFNQNNNMNNKPNFNNKNQLIDEMMEKEINRIKRMNEFIYYANTKNSSQFYSENKILFFGDEPDDIYDTLEKIKKM